MIFKLDSFQNEFQNHRLNLKSLFQIQNGHSTMPSCLQMIITFLFQYRFVHRLNRWILDFSRFKKIYSFPKIVLRKFFNIHLEVRVCVAKFWIPIPMLNFKLWSSTFFLVFACSLTLCIVFISHLSCYVLFHLHLLCFPSHFTTLLSSFDVNQAPSLPLMKAVLATDIPFIS